MRENTYQARLIKRLSKLLPGCFILKNDSGYLQGVPDLTIFYRDRWAVLEVKVSEDAPAQPNQQYYVDQLNEMSYAAFIFPENEEEILREVQQALRAPRSSRVS